MAVRRYNPAYTPPITLVLVGSIVAVTLGDIFTQGYFERLFYARGIDVQYGQYWRMATAAWVHADLIHVAFNLYGIYVLGIIFERLHGWRPLVVVYLVSLLGGTSLAQALMDPNIRLLGASASAYGLFGAVLGYYFAKTGNLRELWAIPIARTLIIWLGVGIWISLQPGVSLLGHVGGFVPGVILGVFFEHRYTRDLDIYHWISVSVVGIAIIAAGLFSCFPVTRSSWYCVRAIKAYETDDLSRGDDLIQEAKGKNRASSGGSLLYQHMLLWRKGRDLSLQEFDHQALRLPLTHPNGIEASYVPPHEPFWFLPWVIDPESLESGDGEP